MKRIFKDWLLFIHWMRSPFGFSDFEDMKMPEHYEKDWFFNRECRGNYA